MTELASYFSGGGIIIALLWFGFKTYMDKRKTESNELKTLALNNSVKDAVQDEKIEQLERRVETNEKEIWEIIKRSTDKRE